jgi:hypothetical protein
LSHLFTVLEKGWLNAEHPDFHSFCCTHAILDGLILNVWHDLCGFPSFEKYSKSNPTPLKIKELACQILNNCAMPSGTFKLAYILKKSQTISDSDDSDDGAPSEGSTSPPPDDIVYENVKCLTHDLLYITELVQAVLDGDFSRVEDILPDLACIFYGAGSNNYSTEILYLLFNLKEVWTPEFAYV